MNRGITVLQTVALPLGYDAIFDLQPLYYSIDFFICQYKFAFLSKDFFNPLANRRICDTIKKKKPSHSIAVFYVEKEEVLWNNESICTFTVTAPTAR